MSYTDEQKKKMLSKVYGFVEKYMIKHTNKPYHNFQHVNEVADGAIFLANLENLGSHQKFLLRTAALTHDLINTFGENTKYDKSDEERTAELVEKKLPSWGYTPADSKIILDLIRATNPDKHPNGILESIIKDADVSNVGKESFMHKGDLIRRELGLAENKSWYLHQKEFLDLHVFYSDAALENWEEQKNKNKIEVLKKISEYQ